MNSQVNNSLVYMEGIKVQFGNVVALNGVNFRVGAGEVVGLLGDNGAGKSTLIKALIGLYRINGGSIYFDGQKVNFSSPREARVAGIETAYQDLALIDRLSISRNFFLGRELVKKAGPFRLLDKKRMDQITAESLKRMGFETFRRIGDTVSFLSGGERQALAIGRANHFCAKLLILDEPTAALSENDTDRLLRLVRDIKKKGISVIFITHKAHEVFEVADRFVILSHGENFTELLRDDVDLKELGKLLISSRVKAVREMASAVAHQIRNPLGILKVSAQMLRDDFQVRVNEDNYKRILNTMINKIDTLNLIVYNFLEFGHPRPAKRKNCSVQRMIESALAALPLSKYPEVEVELVIDENMDEYPMDENLMEQVISNILMNALQASSGGGKVELRSKMEDGRLNIEIRDNGCGIDTDTKKLIFNPFFTTRTSGTGLGLSIVHRIIEQHNGSIEVDSLPGKGTTFKIKI
ncbi:MAG: hypothetical protein DRP87_00335 [Spirochaetes bacterium]|nr:MAG: hypothetical protein DRP87_00335 [Spirochaetota bacterium]